MIILNEGLAHLHRRLHGAFYIIFIGYRRSKDDGKIVLWRDYFDLEDFNRQMAELMA